MTSFQSSLGEDEGVAAELAASQREISIAEFFEKNKHMLGFDSGARGLVTAVKEAVDNALDATEEAGILPDVYVEIEEVGDYYRLVIEDNGPGITKEQLPKVFGKLLYGSRFHSREQSLPPDQQLLVRRDGRVEYVPIGALCETYLTGAGDTTAPVADTIEVPSFTRETHEMSWQPVTHAIRHETATQTYEIETDNGRTLEVTGNHSVFSLDTHGNTREVNAGDLTPGDVLLTPRVLPSTGQQLEELNLLEHLERDRLAETRVDVCGLEHEHAVDGSLPAETVIDRGIEADAADCTLEIEYPDGQTATLPASISVDETLIEALAAYASTPEARRPARVPQVAGAGSTATKSEPKPTRVSALTRLFRCVFGGSKSDRRLPAFVFDLDEATQRQLLAAVYDSDGTTHTHTTQSATLARQLSTLLNMHGVLANTVVRRDASVSVPVPVPVPVTYETTVPDAAFDTLCGTDTQRDAASTRVPTAVLADVRVRDATPATVPDTIPGLLVGAGVGDTQSEAATYAPILERAVDGDRIVHTPEADTDTLQAWGLLDDAGCATDSLRSLWEAVTGIHGITETDMCLCTVTRVVETEPPAHVYDISVPGASGVDENFVVANEGAVSVKNSRGQQGIGISAAVLYSQLTSGQPAKVTSRPRGNTDAQYFELIIDTDTNEPEVQREETTSWDRPHGTRIELEMEANMRARQQLHDYMKHTAVVNPHARFELREPGLDEPWKFERATEDLPAETEEIRPHPHGVELGTLIKLLAATESYSVSGFVQGEFTRVGTKTATRIIDAFRDRHYGRALAWSPPGPDQAEQIEPAIKSAVANKGAVATAAFADSITESVADTGFLPRFELESIVDTVADRVETDVDRRFGETVRANAVDAAWSVITGGADESTDALLVADLHALVDDATSTRKDDETVQAMAEALARRIVDRDDERYQITHDDLTRLVADAASFVAEQHEATFGETARENVCEAIWARARTVPDDPPAVQAIADDRDAAAALLDAMRETDILAPPTSCLAPITAELVEAGLRKEYDADFYAAATRDAEVHGGDPFIVEAGIAYGGDIPAEGSVELLRFANRVPLVYQRGACATTDVIRRIGWRNYGLDQPGGSGLPNGASVISIHVASTNVPFTSESKDAIANVPAIEDEIELAVREAARELKSYLNKRRSMKQRREKQNVLGTILPEMADKVAEVTGRERPAIDGALARIMNNVSVERERSDGTVTLTATNHSETAETLEITDIVSAEPHDLSAGTIVEMDGEWFVRWEVDLPAGEQATLTYETTADAEFDLSVGGVDAEKLTVNA